MDQENIFIYNEDTGNNISESFSKNCNGHFRSMQAGGKGHYVGDSCGCDGTQPPKVNIDFLLFPLMIIAIILIIFKNKIYGHKRSM